jgi:ribosome-associated translation inhibitor RaiA
MVTLTGHIDPGQGAVSPHAPHSDAAKPAEAIMKLPLQISFRGMDTSPATEALIRERAEKLDRFHDRITGCRVVVEASHRHQRKGRLYHVRVDLTVPGHEIVVGRERDDDHSHEDIKVAVRDAFDAARRQLEDHLRIDDRR